MSINYQYDPEIMSLTGYPGPKKKKNLCLLILGPEHCVRRGREARKRVFFSIGKSSVSVQG